MACRSMVWIHFSAGVYFYCQGLSLVRRCSQLSRARHPAAGTPLGQGRPGHGNCPAIGPAARIAWCGGSTRSHSKGDGPNLGLTQFQPRTPGRSLGGNALSGFSSILATQNGPQRSVPARLASQTRVLGESQSLRPGLRRATSLYAREAFDAKKYGQISLTVLSRLF